MKNAEDRLRKLNKKLPSVANAPLRIEYRLKLDMFLELGPQEVTYYELIIGALRWMVKLGVVYIFIEVLMVPSGLIFLRPSSLGQICL